jgi:two-component system response regulator YesN
LGISKGIIYLHTLPADINVRQKTTILLYVRESTLYSHVDPRLISEGCRFSVYYRGENILENEIGNDTKREKGDIVSFTVNIGNFEYQLMAKKTNLFSVDGYILYVLIGAFLFVIGTLLSRFFSIFFYKPIRSIINYFGGYNKQTLGDYRWLENEIANIIKKEKGLQERLEIQRPVLVNTILEHIVHNPVSSDDEFLKLLKILEIKFPFPLFRVVVLHGLTDSMENKIKQFINTGNNSEIQIFKVSIEHGIALIVNYNENTVLYEKIESCIAELEKTGKGISCGLGNKYWDLGKLNESFEQACQAALESYYYGHNKLIHYTPLTGNENGFASQSVMEFDDMLHKDKKGEAVLYLEGLLNHIGEEIKSKNISAFYAGSILYEIDIKIHKFAEELYIPANLHPGHINKVDFMEDGAILRNSCRQVIDYVRSAEEKVYDQHMKKIIDFIDENMYSPELSLKMISDHFNYTSAYISRLFKKYNEKNFIDYVSEHRIEKAKLLLKDTDMPIHTISEETGFYNDTSFRRLFKRITGFSPGKYRAINQIGS